MQLASPRFGMTPWDHEEEFRKLDRSIRDEINLGMEHLLRNRENGCVVAAIKLSKVQVHLLPKARQHAEGTGALYDRIVDDVIALGKAITQFSKEIEARCTPSRSSRTPDADEESSPPRVK